MAVLKPCKNCGETMTVKPSRVDRKKYCSKLCMNEWWRGRRRSPETEFQPGDMPPTVVPVGTESDATKGGYIKVKVAEPNVWKLRSHIVWEEMHGRPLPDGWVVRHLDGDPKNDDPDNLRAIPRSRNLEMTLEDDPQARRRKREGARKAVKRRWQQYRERKREEELAELDAYYWQRSSA